MGPLFDRYVVVDWSANSTPKVGKDSIWSCVFDPVTGRQDVVNHRTRRAARDHLIDVLIDDPGRVLIGFDFPYGFPQGFAVAARLEGQPPWASAWEHLVRHVRDEPDNSNNRFEVAALLNRIISDGAGPFWGTSGERHVTANLSRHQGTGVPSRRLGRVPRQRTGCAPRPAGIPSRSGNSRVREVSAVRR